jgi:hypothetical protein
MKKSLIVFVLSIALAAPALTQNQQPQSRAGRMTSAGIGGGMLGALIGAVANPNDRGSGAWKGAAMLGGISVISAIPDRSGQNGQRHNASGKSKKFAQQQPTGHVPSLDGQLVAVYFEGGRYDTGQFLEGYVFQEFAKLGARPIRQASNSWGQNPCEVPGRKVICVSVGPAAMLASGGGSSSVGIWGRNPVNNGGSNWDQLYAVGVHVDLYDNPANSAGLGWNRQEPTLTPLATAEGMGNASNGSSYLNTWIANRASVSTNSNSWSQPQLATLAAAGQAISKLLAGYGWLPHAEDYLR